ncbi:MAG: hypothetical protein Q8K30_02025 [Candidatus Gracilibacteria bacterium]|nr:hypothetical protein [Candidatus Gracilibacteria bacterium]
MRSKIVIFLFIYLVSINSTSALELKPEALKINKIIKIQNNSKYLKHNKYENENENNNDINNDNKSKNTENTIINKVELKKEIRKRRVYHKNLLYMYNKDFEEKHLNSITHNGLIINTLEKHLKKVSI